MCFFGLMHQSNVLHSNSKYGLKFILNCITFIIGLIRVDFQSGHVMSQDLTVEGNRNFKISLKNHQFSSS